MRHKLGWCDNCGYGLAYQSEMFTGIFLCVTCCLNVNRMSMKDTSELVETIHNQRKQVEPRTNKPE